MSSPRISRAAQRRRFHRYLACGTCGALAGEACTRHPAPRFARASENENPHKGRPRTKETCGDQDRGVRYTYSPCNKPPDHGGEWHVNRHGQQWKVDRSDVRIF